MKKSRVIGLIKYLTSITLSIVVIAGSVMLLFEAPSSVRRAEIETPTVATLKSTVSGKALPKLNASDFDIARSVKVVVTGKPEPKTGPAPSQTASLQTPPVTEHGAQSATVTADAVNLRAASSKQSARVFVVRAGTKVTVHETERGWTRITTEDGITGWLASKFLDR